MKVISNIDEIREELSPLRLKGKKIAVVPTMGYFHEGHLSLMDIVRKMADIVVVTLFVNPTQFGPGEDFERYPRDWKRDEKLAEEHGADIIFYPDVEEMYPDPYHTYVITEKLSGVLCGASRPVHFKGVTTVVAKLFNIIQPDIAVFGQKDAQQTIIIKRMVKDLNFPVEIVVAPIVRERDGLAMSSRNKYLLPEERKQAAVISKALSEATKAVESGEANAHTIEVLIRKKISESDLANIEYVSMVNGQTLENADNIEQDSLCAVAVWFGKTRLIDNVVFHPKY